MEAAGAASLESDSPSLRRRELRLRERWPAAADERFEDRLRDFRPGSLLEELCSILIYKDEGTGIDELPGNVGGMAFRTKMGFPTVLAGTLNPGDQFIVLGSAKKENAILERIRNGTARGYSLNVLRGNVNV